MVDDVSDPGLSEQEHRIVGEGGIISNLLSIQNKSKIKKVRAYGVVDAPPRTVYGVVTDYYNDKQAKMPHCRRVEPLKQEGDQTWVEFDLDLPWPLRDRIYTVVNTDRPEVRDGETIYVSTWEYEQGSGNINDTHGVWEFLPFGENQTLIHYTAYVDPGTPLPAWALNAATKHSVPAIIETVRRRVADLQAQSDER